jgi:hypothetical protein
MTPPITTYLSFAILLAHQILMGRRMRRIEKRGRAIYKDILFFHIKIDNLVNKQDFIAAISDLKTEVVIISGKVDVLEQKINNSPTDVDPDIVAAFQDLKGSVDALNSKADNTPAAPPVDGSGDTGTDTGASASN